MAYRELHDEHTSEILVLHDLTLHPPLHNSRKGVLWTTFGTTAVLLVYDRIKVKLPHCSPFLSRQRLHFVLGV